MKSLIHLAGIVCLASLMALPATAAPIAAIAREPRPVVEVQYRLRTCSPIEAVRKARAYGLRNTRIVAITPRRIVVRGRDHYGPIRIAFSNRQGCPLIRR